MDILLITLQCVVLAVAVVVVSALMTEIFRSIFQPKTFVPYLPTDKKVIDFMISCGQIMKDQKVIDLGSGTGDIVIRVAEKTGAEVSGIELNFGLWIIGLIRKFFSPAKEKITLLRGDMTKVNLQKYDVVVIFISTKMLENFLVRKFESELKPGAKVISYVFSFDSPLFSVEQVSVGKKGFWDNLYIYTKK